MKQQFIGLKHCSCGTSWKKDIGYFQRTNDMVFALERKVVKKSPNSVKAKQVPVVRYKSTPAPEVPFIENEEEYFAAYDFPLDIIPDFEERAFQYAIDTGPPKTDSPKTIRKPAKKKKVKSPQKIQAKEFLSGCLADGAKPKNEIIEAAERIGIPLQALRLAKGSLGVRSEVTDGGSVWFLSS